MQQHPLPHPAPPRNRVVRAVGACDEALAHIVAIQDDLSFRPGTKPELRPEFWLHHLVLLTGYLTMVVQGYLEDEDARQRR